MQPLEMPRVGSWRARPYDIANAIKLLEDNGYLVRRPSEADLAVAVEILPGPQFSQQLEVRCDAIVDGKTLCVAQLFPVELLLSPDDASFREQDAPRMMGRKLGDFISNGLRKSIATALKAKVDPLVLEKRMSLCEIESFIDYALRDPMGRVALADPLRPVERDDRA